MAQTSTPTRPIAQKGIELLTFVTPNGHRVSILLEELKEAYGLDYTTQTIDIYKGVQKQPWFTKLNPNGKVPVIVDHDKGGHAVSEGIAILNYLTRNYDPEFKFSFQDPLEAATAEQWVAWQHGGLGPIQAQANVFYRFTPQRHAFPTQYYVGETERHFGVLNTHLENRDYIAGPGRGTYSVADIAIFPFANCMTGINIDFRKFPNVHAWWERIGQRDAVKKGLCVPGGKPFPFGHAEIQKAKESDPNGWQEREGPLEEALKKAQEEFGYVYKSV